MGVRFPGEASTPESFWELLLNARSAQIDIPKSRYNSDAFYHPDIDRMGATPVRKAHFLAQNPYAFDAPFFSMKPVEAKALDPQQRMLLEVAYQGIENAGLNIETLKGSNTSCYVGSFTGDYKDSLTRDNEGYGQYSGAGVSPSLASNRISWFFDLKGPSMTLDTACSSSLTALHLACQSIKSGEAETSIAAGTNLILGPNATLLLSAAKILSPDGKCHTFDEKANGFGRGEGMSLLVLKNLDAAIRDGNTIRGIVLGTAANHDGKTLAISHPSAESQAALIRTAYKRAGISPTLTGYFEAHGTGTQTGDPLEMEAVSEVFGPDRNSDIFVGSVKTNIGHLEGASSIASVIKSILVVERGIIPQNLWFEKLNPKIILPEHIKIATDLAVWHKPGPRIASINSFGFGGANAHAIVQDAYHFLLERGLSAVHNTILHPQIPLSLTKFNGEPKIHVSLTNGTNGFTNGANETNGSTNGTNETTNGSTNWTNGHDNQETTEIAVQKPKLLIISSKDRHGSNRIAKQLVEYLDKRNEHAPPSLLDNLAFTLAKRRNRMPWKSFAFASDLVGLRHKLDSLPPAVRSVKDPKVAFVFTGQGAQWYAMGRQLFSYDVFRASLQTCEDILQSLGCPWNLRAELHREENSCRLDDAELSQAVCASLQVALVDLLAVWGIRPSAVVGHSSGEIAAAYAAGAVSKKTAIALAWHRGHFAATIEKDQEIKGSMIAVAKGGDQILPLLERLQKGNAVVACYNSPQNCTVSGDAAAVEELQAVLEAESIPFTKLRVKVAYHSPHMQLVASAYLKAISTEMDKESAPITNTVPFFSSVTGKLLHPEELGQEYWVKNLVNPVNFTNALQSLLRYNTAENTPNDRNSSVDALVEVGPHSALRTYALDICSKEADAVSVPYITCLRRSFDSLETIMTAVGELFSLGCDVKLDDVNETDHKAKMLIDLPPYPFNHSNTYFQESAISQEFRLQQYPRTDLLGYPYPGALFPQWRNFLRLRENPWMADHKVQSDVIYPGAGFMVMAIEAIHQLADRNEVITGFELRDVVIGNALRVPDNDQGIEVMTQLKPPDGNGNSTSNHWSTFTIASRSSGKDGGWQIHCRGLVRLYYQSQSTLFLDQENALEQEAYTEAHSQAFANCKRHDKSFYEDLASIGLNFGPTFRNITDLHVGSYAGRAIFSIPNTKAVMPHNFEYPFIIHPATLDAIVQMVMPAITEIGEGLTAPVVPISVESLYLSSRVSSEPGTSFAAFSNGTMKSSTTWDASVCALESSTNSPVVVFKGIGLASLGEGPKQTLSSESYCFETVWKEDIDLLSSKQSRNLIFARAGPEEFGKTHYEMLDLICLPYMQSIVYWLQGEGSQIIDLTGIRKLYYDWMRDKLQENAGLVADPADLAVRVEKASAVLGESEAGAIVVEMVNRIGKNLEGLFGGTIQPLQIMLEGEWLYKFYRKGLGSSFNNHVAEYMAMLSHKNAGQLSVLEVGAGTGGTTGPILDRLRNEDGTSMVARYVFTDISSGFLGNAAKNFAQDSGILEFRTLNIENDPLQQGFEPETFDVLVCANVLHATKSIAETLTHCRSLLKKGGKLVLCEVTEDVIYGGFMMGSLPGWWLGEDDLPARKGGPMMAAQRWEEALQKNGFSGLDIHLHADNPCSVLVSTKQEASQETKVTKKPIHIITDETVSTLELAKNLEHLALGAGNEVSILPWKSVSPATIEGTYCICLLELEKPFLMDISSEDFAKLKEVLYNANGICWVTRGATIDAPNPELSLIQGLARTVMNEKSSVKILLLDLDEKEPLLSTDSHALALNIISTHMDNKSSDYEFAIRNGAALVPRVLKLSQFDEAIRRQQKQGISTQIAFGTIREPVKLVVESPGLLDSICFEHDESYSSPLPQDWVEIEVKAAGLNFKDILVAMGKVKDLGMGFECSGTITRLGAKVTSLKEGDRVFGLTKDAFGNYARLPAETTLKVPDTMTYENAASLVGAFATVYYAFFETGRLRAGESVLIHSAAGGVGQAAIILAQYIGAEIYCTVGSEKKKSLLNTEYGIPEDHIFNSRDHSFAKGIMRMTENKGVDVVLNSLAGEALRLSWHCLADYGRFLELGKVDMQADTGLEMRPFLKNTTFIGINLFDFVTKASRARTSTMQGVADLLMKGVIRPIHPITVFEIGEIEKAFRLMQTGDHMGKIVIRMSDESHVRYTPPPPVISVLGDATYVLAGGVGGVGRELAQWLISRGAKNLLFLSRSAASGEANRQYLQGLRDGHSINAIAYDCDVADEISLKSALDNVQDAMPPIKGVIIGAMVLKDSIFKNMTLEDWTATIRPKVHGSFNLHKHLPKDLQFFVMLSSALGVIGYRGQANYQSGNGFQDALAEHRISQGLPALSIDLGNLAGVGWMGSEHQDLSTKHLRIAGLGETSLDHISTLMAASSDSYKPKHPQVILGLPSNHIGEPYYWMHPARFSALRAPLDGKYLKNKNGTADTTIKRPLREELPQTADLQAAVRLVTKRLGEWLTRLMAVPLEDIDLQKPLSTYGVDSLVAVELRNWIAKDAGLEISVFDITRNVAITQLCYEIAKLFKERDRVATDSNQVDAVEEGRSS
ncbi:polyketide synthase [Stipitochalara longipes BDJ]|nr:polyketide synthase [Stipitochalara longipes BDJ]